MSVVTFDLVDWQGSPRPDLHPIVVFQPSAVGTRGQYVFFTRTIEATPNSSGQVTVGLIDNETVSGGSHYDVSIKWLDPLNNFVQEDILAQNVLVPTGEWVLGDLLELTPTALEVWVGETNNLAYGFWYQPSTTILWSNP